MRRRRAERLQPTHCGTCAAELVDVIQLDGLDRKGCAACEPELIRAGITGPGGTVPYYLERKVVLDLQAAPPCPRCERALQGVPCAGCGYPGAKTPERRRRARREARTR